MHYMNNNNQSMGPSEINSGEILVKIALFLTKEHQFQNVVCKSIVIRSSCNELTTAELLPAVSVVKCDMVCSDQYVRI